MTAYDRYRDRRCQRRVSQDLRHKRRGTNDIQCRNTEDPKVGITNKETCKNNVLYDPTPPSGVKDSVFLENLSDDRDCRVHRVGDDKHICFWSGGCDACRKVTHDSAVDLSVISNW